MNHQLIKVLFVCMGNICRSPAGEGILKHLLKQEPTLNVRVESCGIGDWNLGETPDKRMAAAALLRGIKLEGRAQQFKQRYLEQFDYILVSDNKILNFIYQFEMNDEIKSKIMFMTAFSQEHKNKNVPDPYYGEGQSFERVMDILENACLGFIEHLKTTKS